MKLKCLLSICILLFWPSGFGNHLIVPGSDRINVQNNNVRVTGISTIHQIEEKSRLLTMNRLGLLMSGKLSEAFCTILHCHLKCNMGCNVL